MRVVIVSDRNLSRTTLCNTLHRIPDTVVVAKVDRMSGVLPYCERGQADAVMADAAVVGRDASEMSLTIADLVVEGLSREWPGPDLFWDNVKHPWQVEYEPIGRRLSLREQQVFFLLGMGFSNRRISQVLNVTEPTAKAHVGKVIAKLSLESRLQAGLAAIVYLAQQGTDRRAHPGLLTPQ
jgi:DNA-binding NarL/FixJ family response regulator